MEYIFTSVLLVKKVVDQYLLGLNRKWYLVENEEDPSYTTTLMRSVPDKHRFCPQQREPRKPALKNEKEKL